MPPTVERPGRPVPAPDFVAHAPRVLFFGGSFDPPHVAHASLPFRVARARWPGDEPWIVFVPAARSPHKEHHPAEDRHRVEMLRIALKGRRRWWIWTQELADAEFDPGRPSYWADTWLRSASVFTGERAFLIGTDQACSMHRWRRYTEFWRDALVMLRPGGPGPSELRAALRDTGAWTGDEIDHWMARLVRTETVEGASSDIRAALADPAQKNARIEGLDPGVQKYISQRGLYTPA